MKKADISKIDWLLKNNIAWSEFYKNFSNTYNLLGKQKKDFYRFTGCDRSTFPFKENKMSSFPLVPIFSGNIVSLKYANKVTYDDVQESIKNLYEWIYNNIIKTDKGISIVKSSKNSIYCKYSSYQPFSNFIVDDIFHQSYVRCRLPAVQRVRPYRYKSGQCLCLLYQLCSYPLPLRMHDQVCDEWVE